MFNGFYPWRTGVSVADESDTQDWSEFTDELMDANNTGDCTIAEKLSTVPTTGANSADGCIGADEVKPSFIARVTGATVNPLFIYNGGDPGNSTYICFAPKSKAFEQEILTKYDGSDGTAKDSELTAEEVPVDYPPAAYANADTSVCGPNGNCVCLP